MWASLAYTLCLRLLGLIEVSFLSLLFFSLFHFLCLAQATAVKKNSGFPEGSRSSAVFLNRWIILYYYYKIIFIFFCFWAKRLPFFFVKFTLFFNFIICSWASRSPSFFDRKVNHSFSFLALYRARLIVTLKSNY